MSNVNPAYNNRSRYWLQHNSYPRQLVDESEIRGWNEDDKEYARNKNYDGIFAKFSNNLEFYDTGKNFLNLVRRTHGVNARIRLIKEIKDQDEIWIQSYSGLLDMSTWSTKKGAVRIKFNSSGLQKTLKAREKEKVEIERTTDLNGATIPELDLKELELPGRRVYLQTKFNILSSSENSAKVSVESNAGNTRSDSVGIPLNMFSQSHDLANTVIPQTDGGESQGSTGMMFYANNDRPRLLSINLDFDFDAFFQQYENVEWCRYQVCLTIYQDGVQYNLKERRRLYELRSTEQDPSSELVEGGVSLNVLPDHFDFPYPEFTKHINGTYSTDIELLENESLALEIFMKSDMFFDNNAGVRVFARNMDCNLSITENSSYPATKTKGVLAYELFERLALIMTGDENSFKSSIFDRIDRGASEDGRAAYTFNSHGMWNRRFSAEDDLYKPFQTSFKEAFESYYAAFCIGLGIESIGYGEKIILEDKKYFYNPNVTIRLGELNEAGEFIYQQVNNVSRKSDDDYYFSSIEVGSEKGGQIEDVMGLQETNAKSNFSTFIDAVTNIYKIVMKYRADPYAQETERRRGIETHPTIDRSFDLNIWMNDVKPGPADTLQLKRWQDVLESAPEGMFDPDSGYNFIFSPIQMMIEHDWWLNGGLQEYSSKEIVFGSSTGNSSVTQHRIGRQPYAENGNIPNSDLSNPRFTPEEIEFEYPVSNDLIKIIEGKSTFFGKEIPNLYGLVEFMNEEGQLEKAYVKSLKPNKKGKWKLLKLKR